MAHQLRRLFTFLLPSGITQEARKFLGIRDWSRRGFSDNSPQFVKQLIFRKFAIDGAPWIETGTYKRVSTSFLAQHFPKVYSIEPDPKLYAAAQERFKGRNVELINDVSERALPTLLPKLEGDVTFWLDGHYSGGVTYKGPRDCPVEDELRSIEQNLVRFRKVVILIDDVRCFLQENDKFSGYPSIDYLVDWARRAGFSWRVEHDIFVMWRRHVARAAPST